MACLPVEGTKLGILRSNQEEGRNPHFVQDGCGEMRTASFANDHADATWSGHYREERRGPGGSGCEDTKREVPGLRFRIQPIDPRLNPICQNRHVGCYLTYVQVQSFLCRGEQVEQQSAETGGLQHAGDEVVVRTEAATSTRMREEYEGLRLRRHRQFREERDAARVQADGASRRMLICGVALHRQRRGGGTTNTGQGAVCIRPNATLPINARDTAPPPCVPSTII